MWDIGRDIGNQQSSWWMGLTGLTPERLQKQQPPDSDCSGKATQTQQKEGKHTSLEKIEGEPQVAHLVLLALPCPAFYKPQV
jgi:hypothetical protein